MTPTILSRGVLTLGLLASLLLISGCATPARPDQMTVKSTVSSQIKPPAHLIEKIALQSVTGGRETNALWMSNVGSDAFEQALEQSLRAAGYLASNRQSGNYLLTADLGKLDQPLMGLNMTVTSTVKYSLVERATRREVFSTTILAPYTASVSDAFIGTERLKLANEGAIRENIGRLIEELSRHRIDKVALN